MNAEKQKSYRKTLLEYSAMFMGILLVIISLPKAISECIEYIQEPIKAIVFGVGLSIAIFVFLNTIIPKEKKRKAYGILAITLLLILVFSLGVQMALIGAKRAFAKIFLFRQPTMMTLRIEKTLQMLHLGMHILTKIHPQTWFLTIERLPIPVTILYDYLSTFHPLKRTKVLTIAVSALLA